MLQITPNSTHNHGPKDPTRRVGTWAGAPRPTRLLSPLGGRSRPRFCRFQPGKSPEKEVIHAVIYSEAN
jgi:hypothetical protein